DVEKIIARRAAPIDAGRWLAHDKAAVLPEILAGASAAPAVQSVDDGGGDAPRIKDQPRHARREGLAFANRVGDCRDVGRRRREYSHHPIRDFRHPTTPGMVSPSARAAKVSAMRCLSTGSASAMTSSADGAKRPSRSARARTVSIRAWLARGLGPQ